jgi:hypothetical protein
LGKPDLLEKISTVALAIRKFFKSLESPDRTITEAEFTKKIRELGVLKETVSDDELHDLFKKFDIDGNGAIDYIEWTQMLRLEDMYLSICNLYSFIVTILPGLPESSSRKKLTDSMPSQSIIFITSFHYMCHFISSIIITFHCVLHDITDCNSSAAKMPLLDEHETQLLENMVNR